MKKCKTYKITIVDKVVAKQVKVASSFVDRLIGLMFVKSMEGFDGLLISPCNSIHTFFMRFPLDIIFLNSNMEVVKVVRNMSPWRVTLLYFSSSVVLELSGGTFPEDVQKGTRLDLQCIS